jgi:hypothetical protein
MTDDDDIQEYARPCSNCEYHRKRAQLWRDEAYKQSGHPLPERDDDHVLIDAGLLNSDLGMLRTRGTRTWVGLTDEEKDGKRVLENGLLFNSAEVQVWELAVQWAEAKLKEKNT